MTTEAQNKLLKTLEGSVVQNDTENGELYMQYYYLIKAALEPVPDNYEVSGGLLSGFKNADDLGRRIRNAVSHMSAPNELENCMKEILSSARKAALPFSKVPPSAEEQKFMRLKVIERTDEIMLDLRSDSRYEQACKSLSEVRDIMSHMLFPKSSPSVSYIYERMMEKLDRMAEMFRLRKYTEAMSAAEDIRANATKWRDMER